MRLNEQQQKIVQQASGKVAVIAGAGTGKTTTVVELIVKLYEQDNIPLEEMFISTFTNKAGREIKERLKKRCNFTDDLVGKLWVGTFHGLGYRYLKNIKRKNLNIILPVESEFYLKNVYKQIVEEKTLNTEKITYDLISQSIETKRNKNISWEDASEFPDVCEEIYKIYQEEKTKSNLADFTDILNMFANNLEEDNHFRNRFKWVFVDESQDNNFYQNRIADLLTTRNIIFVGDIKQQLYIWRGACPNIFKERISNSENIFDLSHNYRSTKSIINFANKLLEQFPQFKGQELVSTGDLGEKPIFYMCDSLAKTIFENIKRDIKKGIPLHEIAVLARSVKSMNIGELEILLRSSKIPYTVRGGNDKLNAVYVQTYLSVLKSIVNPTRISLLNSLSILPSVGPKTASKLADSVLEDGDFFAISGVKTKYSETAAYKDYIKLTTQESPRELLLRSFDFISDHYLASKYKETASQKRDVLFKLFFDYLLEYPSLSEGIDSLYVNEEDAENDKDKIVISTVHQSKGLEFDSVHIANFQEFSIPYVNEEEEANPLKLADKLEEEFCLAYVAVTRARKHLDMYMEYVTGAGTWERKNKLSRFIKNVLRTSGEHYMKLRMLDVDDEFAYKDSVFRTISVEVKK